MRILVLKGQSQYGGTRLFADHAAAAFNRLGHPTDVLDLGLGEPSHAGFAAAAQSKRYGLVLSFNILGDFRSPTGQTMAELFGCPHVVWHTDYILASWERLLGTPPATTLLVVDPTQIAAAAAATGDDAPRVRFFPHPAVGEPVADEPDVQAFVARRPIPMLWSGGFVQSQRPWGSAPAATRQVLDAALELALSVEWMAPHVALTHALREVGLDVRDPAKRHNLVCAALLDAEVRVRRRHAFLLALAASGVELHICGHGWEPHLHLFNNATYHGPVEMTRMVELMRQSRVVLNTNGNFGAGSHERPFSAALAGAACFSDFSRYYAAEFRPGQEIELFFWRDLPGAMHQLHALAADPERCWRLAGAAKALTLAKHTWDHQAPDILQAAGLGAPSQG